MRNRDKKACPQRQIGETVTNFDSSPTALFRARSLRSHQFKLALATLVLAVSFQASAQTTCQALFASDVNVSTLSTRQIAKTLAEELTLVENDPAFEIRISGQELAADITEAMLANPGGFNHRDAEQAIIRNLGDLSAQASEYIQDSNLWVNSNHLQVSMAELQYATDDFISASKSFHKLSQPGFVNKILNSLPFMGKMSLKDRKLKDLVQSLQFSRHRVMVARRKLNEVLASFEKLNKNFAGHYLKMNRSIDILKSALSEIKTERLLDEDERSKAEIVLNRYLQNVTTSISTSHMGLSSLHMTFTNHDFIIQQRQDELKTATDLMMNVGVSADILKQPFYVKESLEINPYVDPSLTEIFYSGQSPEQALTHVYNMFQDFNSNKPVSADSFLVALKLLPKTSQARIKWTELLGGVSNYYDQKTQKHIFSNDESQWSDNENLRSSDLAALFRILNSTVVINRNRTHAIEKAEFARIEDYVEDIINSSQSLKNDGLNSKLKSSIRAYLKLRAAERSEAILKALENGNEG